MTHSIVIHNAQQLGEVIASFNRWAKARVTAGRKVHMRVSEANRTLPQNDHIHPLVRAIAKAADRKDEDRLRALLVEQWRAETGRAKQFVPSLDGARMVDVSNNTKGMDKPEAAEFIDWLYAWGAEHGVEFAVSGDTASACPA